MTRDAAEHEQPRKSSPWLPKDAPTRRKAGELPLEAAQDAGRAAVGMVPFFSLGPCGG